MLRTLIPKLFPVAAAIWTSTSEPRAPLRARTAPPAPPETFRVADIRREPEPSFSARIPMVRPETSVALIVRSLPDAPLAARSPSSTIPETAPEETIERDPCPRFSVKMPKRRPLADPAATVRSVPDALLCARIPVFRPPVAHEDTVTDRAPFPTLRANTPLSKPSTDPAETVRFSPNRPL